MIDMNLVIWSDIPFIYTNFFCSLFYYFVLYKTKFGKYLFLKTKFVWFETINRSKKFLKWSKNEMFMNFQSSKCFCNVESPRELLLTLESIRTPVETEFWQVCSPLRSSDKAPWSHRILSELRQTWSLEGSKEVNCISSKKSSFLKNCPNR